MPTTIRTDNQEVQANSTAVLAAASVSVVDDIPFDDEDANLVDTQAILGADIPNCIMMGRYEGDMHRYMLSITSPNGFQGNSVAFCQLGGRTLLWVVDWTVESAQGLANIPDPDNSNSDWVLLADWVDPSPVSNLSEGNVPIYRISGTYVYGYKNPSDRTYKDVTIPKMPWIEPGSFTRKIDDSKLDKSYLEDTGQGGGSQTTSPGPGQFVPNIKPAGNIKG